MHFQQLICGLSYEQFKLMQGFYRGDSYGSTEVYEDGKVVRYENTLYLKLIKRIDNSILLLSVNPENGIVQTDNITQYFQNQSKISLENLFELLQTKQEELDLTDLYQTISNHNIDLELRRKLMCLVAQKLLSSKKSGYEKTKTFIEDLNRNILGLELTLEEIMGDKNNNLSSKTFLKNKRR